MIIPDEKEIAAVLGNTAETTGPETGICDCHVHVFGASDRFPPARGFSVDGLEDLTPEAYRERIRGKGVDRLVLVQPDHHGKDHSCLINAMEDFAKDDWGAGRDAVRGVASVRADVEDREIEDLLSIGMVGTRFVMHSGKETHDWLTIDRLAWRVHDFGWDVELEMDGSDLHEVEQTLREWPGRIVLDHIGLFLRTKTLTQRCFKALTRLIDRDKVWVKLSAPYLSSRRGRPDDPEVDEIARALVDWAPERMVWGSNWPRADVEEAQPDHEASLGALSRWVPEESRRARILRDNPMALYGFKIKEAELGADEGEGPAELLLRR
jgi:D-galactarolactone isomerase